MERVNTTILLIKLEKKIEGKCVSEVVLKKRLPPLDTLFFALLIATKIFNFKN